jgi:hypothetical protein
MNKGILLVLVLVISKSLLLAEELNRRLLLNGSFGLGVKFVDIDNKEIEEYPPDFSYEMDISTIGRLYKHNLGGILKLRYDRNNADINYVRFDLETKKVDTAIGDLTLDLSEFTLYRCSLRGLLLTTAIGKPGDFFTFGQSQAKKAPTKETPGSYRQWLGTFRLDTNIKECKVGGTYLEAKDETKTMTPLEGVNPIKNRVIECDLSVPITTFLRLNSEVAFSEYTPDIRKPDKYRNKAFMINQKVEIKKFNFSSKYEYIEPNFFTAGNKMLSRDKEGGEFLLEYIDIEKRFWNLGLGYSVYKDNLDKSKLLTTRKRRREVNLGVKPKPLIDDLSLGYQIITERSNEVPTISPPKIDEEEKSLAVNISRNLRATRILLSWQKSELDDKVGARDLESSYYSMNIMGDISKNLALFCNLSFSHSIPQNARESKSYSYFFSTTYEPNSFLKFIPSYTYFESKEKKSILKTTLLSLEIEWAISPRYQLIANYEKAKKLDITNPASNYDAQQLGIRLTSLF